MLLKAIDWNELQAISTTILVLTSAGAIGYAALQLRQEREYRSVANLETQITVFHGETFRAARKRLATDRLVNDQLAEFERDTPPVSALEVLDFYDHIGHLVRKGHLELYDVWHTFYEWAQPVYNDMRPLIEDPESAFEDHYLDLRWVMRKMDEVQIARMHDKKANHWALWTPDRIIDHYKYEIESGGRMVRRTRKKAAEQNLIVSSS